MAERLSNTVSVAAVYAAAVEGDGVTVIPVSKIRWGFDGGNGAHEEGNRRAAGSGGGAGGGVIATRLGYIELRAGASEYKPIRDPASVAMLVLGVLRHVVRQ